MSIQTKSKYDAHFLDKQSLHPRPSPTVSSPTFSVLGHAIINAPPAAVYDALLDLPNYRNWNTFIPNAELKKSGEGAKTTDTTHMHTGAVFEFTVKMKQTSDSLTKSTEICTLAEPLKTSTPEDPFPVTKANWIYDVSGIPLMKHLLWSEHVHEIIDLGDGRTEYVHWESFGGVLATLIKWFASGDLARSFREWPEELKVYVEGKQGRS
ncbi:hypothetical protein Q7P35_004508 [Cladosporium inversicolor]